MRRSVGFVLALGAGALMVLAACAPGQAPAAPTVGAAAATVATGVRITDARLDPSDVTITVQNVSGTAVDLTGWRLRVGSATAALPSSARVGPDESVTIHTAPGATTARDIYLGQEASALVGGLRPGATVALVDPQGTAAAEFVLPG